LVRDQPSSQRRAADRRFSGRISQGEHIPNFENIPRQN
jgi:hypothetical protein